MTLNPSLLALLIVPALVYLLVPLLILATFRIDAEITLAPTRVEDLGAAARARLAWLLASLGEQGFIHAIHRARVLASGRATEPTLLPQPGKELAFQAEDWRRELRHVEQTGNFRLAPDGQHFTMTPKGAYLMTGRIMWPGKWIRAARQRLQANRVLQNLRAAGHELPI